MNILSKRIIRNSLLATAVLIGTSVSSIWASPETSTPAHVNHLKIFISNESDRQVNVKVLNNNNTWSCERTLLPNESNVDVCMDASTVEGDGLGMSLAEGPQSHRGSIFIFLPGQQNTRTNFYYDLKKIGYSQYNWKTLKEVSNPMHVKIMQDILPGDCLMSKDTCSMMVKFTIPSSVPFTQ